MMALRFLCLQVGFSGLVRALDLASFGGQAASWHIARAVPNATEAQTSHIMRRAGEEEQEYSCDEKTQCEIGCCKIDAQGVGVCGLGPEFCGADVCFSTCDYKSECDPGWGIEWSNASACPLEVCCSDFGFCGTTADFCGGATIASPSCSKDAHSSDGRTIGYYEGWNYQRSCGTMEPSEIPLGYYTHINFAFALIDPDTFRMDVMDEGTASRYSAVTALKNKQENLQVWIAVGGWAMNDPGKYRTAFSDMASSRTNQDAFIDSLLNFMKKYDFDGVDIDWEYPVAEDRGGIEADFDNYVSFLALLRERLTTGSKVYGISLTLPASYWYLKGFNIVEMEPHIDWFNIMTYDIHGVWDSTIESLGPYAYAHTNLTEIQTAMELLWRNNINPERVTLGLGFYGRSFTMKDPSCLSAGCEFTDGAHGGECTGTPGVLSAAEIVKIIANGGTVAYDEAAAIKIVTWDSNQWVSWDDAETLAIKVDYANQHCLGGTMVWAIDLDDGTLIDALGESIGREKEVITEIDPRLACFGTGDLNPDSE